MTGEPDRIRAVLVRSGGLLGRPLRRGLDTADLPEPAGAFLRKVVLALWKQPIWDQPVGDPNASPPLAPGPADPPLSDGKAGGADRFFHVLTVTRGDTGRTRTFAETVPPALIPLVELLRTAPRQPPRDADL